MTEPPRARLRSAVAAFVALPLMVAFVIPLAIGSGDPRRGALRWEALVCTVCGTAILLRTVRDFFTVGGGTLAPWNPPRTLVTSGLFAWCRNPMYVGVLLVIAGHAWMFASPSLAVYAVVAMVAFHLRVVLYEEPQAARRFPAAWPAYCARVPRWLPRPPWSRRSAG